MDLKFKIKLPTAKPAVVFSLPLTKALKTAIVFSAAEGAIPPIEARRLICALRLEGV
jgi:hypothetical protein